MRCGHCGTVRLCIVQVMEAQANMHNVVNNQLIWQQMKKSDRAMCCSAHEE